VKDTPSARPLAAKLGIKPGFAVGLLGAPAGFADRLAPLPASVTLSARSLATHAIFVCFVRASCDLDARLAALASLVERQTVWLAWPKKASGVASDLDGTIVRTRGLSAGWVDFKVCAIDPTWSALAFKKRARR
jgi:hypothetical protein